MHGAALIFLQRRYLRAPKVSVREPELVFAADHPHPLPTTTLYNTTKKETRGNETRSIHWK